VNKPKQIFFTTKAGSKADLHHSVAGVNGKELGYSEFFNLVAQLSLVVG
jgi:hypothetical protein